MLQTLNIELKWSKSIKNAKNREKCSKLVKMLKIIKIKLKWSKSMKNAQNRAKPSQSLKMEKTTSNTENR